MDRNYNCIMVGYGPIEKIEKIQESIDENDILQLEKEPHITLLYGLYENVTWDDVKKYLSPLEEYKTMLYNISLFENDEFDVLKMDINSDKMIKTNKLLRDNLPHDDLHPEYHPHMTIAYLKAGTGKKYEKNMLDRIIGITPTEFLYSYGNKDTETHKTLD